MFEGLRTLMTGQGPLFWGAAAAAALGAALLSAALVMHLRRLGPAFRRPRLGRLRFRLRPSRPSRTAVPGLAKAVPGGYAPARPVMPSQAQAPVGAEAPDLEPLLARLRRASDRLAAIQAETGDSRLKAAPARTEQLYRRGVG
ncbi:MAG: hypothetical protein IPP62_02540 [bacterium]|jgi:hypothetical protein|nr:hypothetical protein [bacterium]